MRLLIATDLALRVLMRLSASPDKHASTDVLSRELAVSRNHLQKIVQHLTEAGFVRTIRGAHGGVMLARPAEEIRVGDVVRDHEQDQALVECFRLDGGDCTLLPRCRLRGMLAGASDAFYDYLNQYTLADCLGSPSPERPQGAKGKRPQRTKALNA